MNAMIVHGGGWISGSLETHDEVCRAIAWSSASMVIAVDYRLAPEHRFPAGLNDCYTALEWISNLANQYEYDTDQIYVAGDNAGGKSASVPVSQPVRNSWNTV